MWIDLVADARPLLNYVRPIQYARSEFSRIQSEQTNQYDELNECDITHLQERSQDSAMGQ